ncbi:aminotransferase class IV [Cephaloticoccus capnophilus]|uniref:branched-chain-amino-acid transaminase n=1 Tax=Cephaloticoccus capnophilus TaxID=1548208 RepID=A0A139SNS2_9BACT|nr:aminotransferase class IV [Cephaloticoccus capnophilus]KXU36237.1 aminotransferase class IV [Cephaloticoccus capnophilus]
MQDYIQANTNGHLHDAREASISPLDRGFLYGDAVYEVWRTYDSVVFAWAEHWARLEQSAAALGFILRCSPEQMFGEIRRTAAAYRVATSDTSDLYIRLQITRGAGTIGLDPGLADGASFVILVRANKGIPDDKLRAGYTLSLATTLRRNSSETLNPAWKTGNYLNNILCLGEARRRGADEVVMTNLAGEVAESSVCNLGFVRRSAGESGAVEIVTPPLRSGILAGITRELMLAKIAPEAGFAMREAVIRPEDFSDFEECFLMATTRDIAPVGQIDGRHFRVGERTVTMRLKAAFSDYVARYVAVHPEQRL